MMIIITIINDDGQNLNGMAKAGLDKETLKNKKQNKQTKKNINKQYKQKCNKETISSKKFLITSLNDYTHAYLHSLFFFSHQRTKTPLKKG